MPKDFPRQRRVAEQVRRELSELVQREIKDPRVGLVTISDVEVSGDFAHAKVYISTLGHHEGLDETLEALNHAAGFLRRELGRRMRIRTVPALRFLYDESFDRGARLSHLIDEAVEDDRRRHEDDDHTDDTDG